MNVIYVDHMGSDTSVVNAARCSYGNTADSYTEEQNRSLIYYLARGLSSDTYKKKLLEMQEGVWTPEEFWNQARKTHTHFSPFTHTAITLQITAPIPIRTQCFKSKIGFSENEQSRRYMSNLPEVFTPTFRNKAGKQTSGDEHLKNEYWQAKYQEAVDTCLRAYQRMIEDGVAPEQARFILPQGMETTWVWTGSLLAYSRFYQLRSSPEAQKEVQELASLVRDVIKPLFPISWSALNE